MKQVRALISIVMFFAMLLSYGLPIHAEDNGVVMPEQDKIIAAVKKVNDHYQATVNYDQSELGLPNCFLYKTVYQTGNIEAYYTTGNEAYLEYAENWAEACNWVGNPSKSDKDMWTWDYSQTLSGSAVLFSHFQGCFQVYIDLYNIEKNETEGEITDKKKIERAIEVMSYQTEMDEDSFWWMAESLYMGLPVMVKLYHLTGEEKYLNSMYRYFKYTKELLYDGPGGIPENKEGYTTSAGLNSGAQYSNKDDYECLFYRNASYVYPLKPYDEKDEKNFFSVSNGLAFAGLAKALEDLPESYEHYNEFLNTYTQMAQAIKNNMCIDENGYGFWMQNMLLKEPTAFYNPNGYETYSTSMFVFALAWGINAGILDCDEYAQTVIRAWNYLENIALKDDGSLRYSFDIARSAPGATTEKSNINSYAVGAFLLAGCEMSTFVGKVNETGPEGIVSGDRCDITYIPLRAMYEVIGKAGEVLRALLDK